MTLPRLLWLAQGGDTLPSVRFRVLPLVEEARRQGAAVTVMRYPKTVGQRGVFLLRLGRASSRYDVCIIQKRLLGRLEIGLLRRVARRVVFDFDDAVWTDQEEAAGPGAGRRWSRFRATTSLVDGVLAGNSYLASALEYPAHILPTPLDTTRYRPGPDAGRQSSCVIGWMGTASYLPEIETVVRLVHAATGALVRVISNAPPTGSLAQDCDFRLWSPESEVQELQNMDIGLMPLSDTAYTRGKCGFKLLQYMACGAVPLASAVGFNRELITHGVDGFLVENEVQWLDYVRLLVDDAGLRRTMAQAARATVVQRFDLRVITADLLAVLGKR